ncbi:beta-ketoacyl synthase N-terminal-like domain-containing protein [uncultured Veillonella sp.]|uniref:thiolase family protein n=1 Tax=uncultured Veillonella sp. TaxID=159268 RepID=UPI0025D44B85|nr:beta-ketoacyl synthase N-terminal-like domain-containing protein [uncultured Veillonella sp.]MDY3973771.1 beta-ketoacyl synthase N-terminal-like domain-containing protein [Veillonella caviae]
MVKQVNSFPNVYIMGGLRTPIGVYKGQYKMIRPEFLGAAVLNELHRQGYKAEEIICGNAVGTGGNIGRLMSLYSAYGEAVPSYTVDMQCASSAMAIGQGFRAIRSGLVENLIAGGMESCSLQPMRVYSPEDSRFKQMPYNADHEKANGQYMVAQFSPHTLSPATMLEGAHATACKHSMTKEELDFWTLRSHSLAVEAKEKQLLEKYIVPNSILKVELGSIMEQATAKLVEHKTNQLVEHKTAKLVANMDHKTAGFVPPMDYEKAGLEDVMRYELSRSDFKDESIKSRMSQRLLDRMPPILHRDSLLTAANTCYTHDGAAFVGLTTEPQEFKIVDILPWAGAPQLSPEGAWQSTEAILKRNHLTMDDMDAVEWNEAFAVIDVLFERAYKEHVHKYNQLGGALAYGHAYGASGAVNLLHLMAALKHCDGHYGVTAIAGAGGTGVAMLIERQV